MASTILPKTLVATKRVSGAYALIDSLLRHDVKRVFGYPGGAILPIYDEIYRAEANGLMKHILVRHEQAASHAADGYARATGKVGVCFATSGPGATNLVTGIATAQMDSIPMVAITGQVARAAIGTDAFQEADICGITLPIVKHSYIVHDPNQIAQIVAEAFYIAKTGRPGPVLIDVPKDVGVEKIDYLPVEPEDINLSGYAPLSGADYQNQIDEAITLLRSAERPLLYIGGGAVSAGAHSEIQTLAEAFAAPMTNTLMGKGAVNEHHSLSVGMLGMHGTAYANFTVSRCDLLVAIGARFDDRVTGKLDEFASEAKVIHIDIDSAEIGKNRVPEVPIVGDVKVVLKALLSQLANEVAPDKQKTQAWRNQIDTWRKDFPLRVPAYTDKISPQSVIVELAKQAPNAYYTTDVGQHQMWAAQFLKTEPRRWISSAGLGTMGFGLPSAMGAKVAFPDEQVICISGDASFQMSLQELATLNQYGIDVKTVILNNGWQGMVRQHQQAFYGERYSSSNMDVGMPDFVLLSKSFGIKGIVVNDPRQISEAISQMLNHDGPVVMDVRVCRTENVYPMIRPGRSNADMIGLL